MNLKSCKKKTFGAYEIWGCFQIGANEMPPGNNIYKVINYAKELLNLVRDVHVSNRSVKSGQ